MNLELAGGQIFGNNRGTSSLSSFGSRDTFLGCSPSLCKFPKLYIPRRSSRAARPPFVYEACAALLVRNSRAQRCSRRWASALASSWVMFAVGALH